MTAMGNRRIKIGMLIMLVIPRSLTTRDLMMAGDNSIPSLHTLCYNLR